MRWALIETCCGSAALSLHLLGAPKQLVPYQGSKWALRKQLSALLVRLGYWGAPSEVWLGDVGPAASAMQQALSQSWAVAEQLRPLVSEGGRDPRALYARLHGGEVPSLPALAAAEWLWLQRMAFSGKAVGVREGRWFSAGLNITSALGVAATERFGEVKPLGPALLRAVEAIPDHGATVIAWDEAPTANDWREDGPRGVRPVVLIDPPYQGTLGYPCGDMPREEVVALAEDWHACGATVIVCEAEAIDALVARGWTAERIQEGRGGARARMQALARLPGARGEEWVTYRRACAAREAA